MSDRFKRALELLAVHEGGYVDHPDDPGGRTNKGVTQATYDAFRERRGLPPAHVRDITEAEVEEIYRTEYWNAVRADALPPGVAYATFDAAVNSGVAQAARWLQRAVGAKVDGIVGEQTLRAAHAARDDATIDAICRQRLKFMRGLKHYETFGLGWERRVSEVRDQALRWASNARVDGERAAESNMERRPLETPAACAASAPASGPRTWRGLFADLFDAIREALQ